MITSVSRWSPSKVLKLLSLYAVLLLVVWAFIHFLDLLMAFLLAGLFAFTLSSLIDRLEGAGLSRTGAVIAVYVSLGALLGGTIWFLSPYVVTQEEKFQRALPAYVASVEQMVSGLSRDVKKMESKNGFMKMLGVSKWLSGAGGNNQQHMVELLGKTLGSMGLVLSSVLSWLGNLALAPFLAFFFLRDGPSIKKKIIEMVPNRYFEMALSIHFEVDRQIRSFFKGQFLEGLCVGVLAWLGLWWIGLNYAFFIGMAAGVTNLIPYFGPVVGSVLGVAVALIDGQSIPLAVKVIAVLMGVQFLDSAVLSTIIMGKSVDMHPVLIVFALIMGSYAMGIMGMLLGVPLLAATLVTMKILAHGFESYRI